MEQKINLTKEYEIISESRGIHLISVNNLMRGLQKLRRCLLVTLCLSPLLLPGLCIAQNDETDQIKKVITAETEAHVNADGNAWQATWLHDASITRTFISPYNYSITTGWENFGPDELTELKKRKPIAATLNNTNYRIKIDGNLAWVEYDQLLKGVDDTTMKGVSHEYRGLEKKAGDWKIFSQITVSTDSYEFTPVAVEENFNTMGYRFLEHNQVKEAIEVFQLNVKLYPGAYNTYDSLGEAYAIAGQKDLAIKNYQRSVELNPKNENGIAALAKLKLK